MIDRSGSPSRRRFLALAGGTATAAGLAGCTASREHAVAPSEVNGSSAAAVAAGGAHQGGIVRPAPAQAHLLTVVLDLNGRPGPVLRRIGETVLRLTTGRDPMLAGMPPGDLTVTVGVGPRLVRSAGDHLPGADDLPPFPRERMSASDRGGDVMVQLCASDPLLLPGAATAVIAAGGLTERWRQAAFRGPNVAVGSRGSAPRNLLGFVDGIVVPRGDAEYDRDVWLPAGTPAAGGTIAVLRRMEIDVERFLGHDVAAQERIIGRRRASAAPLSGGTAATNPDLGGKTPSGAYLIPADAHLRRANPVSTGVPTMLRRSYSFADTASGLFFVSFQNELQTFVATLNRMSTSDALLDYTTTTRSGTFLVLPGFDPGRPLGGGLFR